MTPRDRIDIARVRAALVGTRFNGELHHFATINSTNSALLADAATGAPEGTVYFADEQTAGRGRGDHAWHSAPCDGLYLSALVRPALRLEDALLLSLATGLAAQHAILEATTVEVDLRWPNDLMLPATETHAEKKLGGILVETAVEPGRDPLLRYAVIGVGINVHQHSFPPELAPLATSLYLAEQARHDDPDDVMPLFRGPLLIALLRALDMELLNLESMLQRNGREREAHRARLLARFAESSNWVHDKRVHVPEQGGYTGTTAGLDPRGFLLVQCDDGRLRTVLSGGVRAF